MTVDVWVCCGGRAVVGMEVVCRSHPRRFRLLFRFRSRTSFLPLLLHLFPQIYRLERVYTSFTRLCTPIFRGVYIYISIGVCDAPCLDGRDAVVVDLKKEVGGEIICTSVISREEMQLRSKIGASFLSNPVPGLGSGLGPGAWSWSLFQFPISHSDSHSPRMKISEFRPGGFQQGWMGG